MDIALIVVPLVAVAMLGAALRAPLPHAMLPVLFLLMVASASLGYLSAAHGWRVIGAVAIVGAAAATVALAAAIWGRDAQLAAAAAGVEEWAAPVALPGSRRARWRHFERDFWAHVAHRRGHAQDAAGGPPADAEPGGEAHGDGVR
jgi:hypothetical protein